MHGSDLATAPVHTVAKEQEALGSDLALVEQFLPVAACAPGNAPAPRGGRPVA